MALTTLDDVTALVIVDLQKGIVAVPSVHPMAEIVARSSALAAAFRRHGLPVVLVNANGSAPGRTEQPSRLTQRPDGWTDLLPELEQQPNDIIVTKQRRSAFTGTGLETALKARGVAQLVIAGVATSVGVESTARHAHDLDFNVTLATDAMTDVNADAHHNSVARIFPRLGETGMTNDIIALLDGRNA